MSSAITLDTLESVLKLALAIGAGAVIGWNRQRKNHPAGLRTMMLVSLGAAGFMVLGEDIAVTGIPSAGDRSRVVQGIVGGIGFLGAGTIIRSGGEVKGVTTAAAIWVVAALGACLGMGMYVVGLAMTVLTTLILWLAPLESAVFKDKNGKAGGWGKAWPEEPESPEPKSAEG
jgi:putative Mg2+ transporter-C (MgtC) family protein